MGEPGVLAQVSSMTSVVNQGRRSYQAPVSVALVQVDDCADVVVQGDVDVQAAGDPNQGQQVLTSEWSNSSLQSASLEKIIVIFSPSALRLLFWEIRSGLREPASLVDLRKLLDDIIVEAVEHDENHTRCGRKLDESRFGVAVRLQLAVLEGSDLILVLLIVAVQNRQVQIA